jgi:hypothetical protein
LNTAVPDPSVGPTNNDEAASPVALTLEPRLTERRADTRVQISDHVLDEPGAAAVRAIVRPNFVSPPAP